MFDISSPRPNLAPVFHQIADKEIAFVTRVTITRLSAVLQKDLTKEILRAFDEPVAFTVGAVKRKPVGTAKVFAYQVYLRDEASGGTPPAKYLAPEVYGGPRRDKRFERALRYNGILADGLFAFPGIGAQRNANGNMPSGQIKQILSYLKSAENTAGYQANTSAKRKRALAKTTKKRRGTAYFVSAGPGKGKAGRGMHRQHLPAGIWQRTSFGPLGSAIKPVLIFGKQPQYKPRLRFYEVTQTTINREWSPMFTEALRDSLTKWAGKG